MIGKLDVIVGEDGGGVFLIVMVAVAGLLKQELTVPQRTLYEVVTVGATVILCVVSPVDHKNPLVQTLPVKTVVEFSPEQYVVTLFVTQGVCVVEVFTLIVIGFDEVPSHKIT